jgi:uncharacterized membrane protein YraQ (UPF0718 family)
MEVVWRELSILGRDFLLAVEHVWVYFLIGVVVGALIRTFRLHVKIRKALPRFGFWGVFAATGVGIISPLCACGVLPIAVSLLVVGMPLAPAMSLVIASPLMSPEGYAITAGLLGTSWANAKLASAVFFGLFAGLLTHLLTNRGFATAGLFRQPPSEMDIHDPDYPDERLACDCPDQFSNRLARRVKNKGVIFLAKAWELIVKVGRLTLLGLVIEVLAMNYIPSDWIAFLFGRGHDLFNIPLIILSSIPLHVNQITAASILFGPVDLLGAEISKGAGLAFLIGGPVTALPVMGVFLSLFRKRVFFLYLFLCVTGSLIVSYVYNLI